MAAIIAQLKYQKSYFITSAKLGQKQEFQLDSYLILFHIQTMSYNDRYFNRIHKGLDQVRNTL